MKGLGKRLLTAAVAVPLLIVLIGFCPWQGFGALAFLALAVGLHEFFAIVLVEETPGMRRASVFWGLLVLVLTVLWWQPPAPGQRFVGFPASPAGLPVMVLALIGVALMYLFARGGSENKERIPGHIGLSFLGALYLGLFGAHIVFLGRLPDGLDLRVHHGGWVFLALACTFLSDTGGYFFGKGIGGPKLFPAVSPNKTWAGLFGCIVGASVGAWGTRYFVLPGLQWYDCLVIGTGVALLGQSGDFFESMLKRAFGVKDSGTILPGHGGILDRIDALLFNGPFIFYYATWVVLAR